MLLKLDNPRLESCSEDAAVGLSGWLVLPGEFLGLDLISGDRGFRIKDLLSAKLLLRLLLLLLWLLLPATCEVAFCSVELSFPMVDEMILGVQSAVRGAAASEFTHLKMNTSWVVVW